MRDNPEGGELDPAEGVRRRCKNYSSAPTFRRLIVVVRSPPLLRVVCQNSEAIFPEGSDHPVAPNRLEFFGICCY